MRVGKLVLTTTLLALVASCGGSTDNDSEVMAQGQQNQSSEVVINGKKYHLFISNAPTPQDHILAYKKQHGKGSFGLAGSDAEKEGFLADEYFGLGGTLATLDQMVNTGKKLWDLLKEAKGSVSSSGATANAVPKGLKAMDLAGFKSGQPLTRQLVLKSQAGLTVVDAKWTLFHDYNGSYKGKGRYLSGVSVVSTAWAGSFANLEIKAKALDPVNGGSAKSPVAMLKMIVEIKASSNVPFSGARTFSNVYSFSGTSAKVDVISEEK
ncbi:MAG: hypothetical protein AB7T49_02895 [Oligoflexales bacterium]